MTNEVKIRATLDDKVSAGLTKIRGNLDAVGGKGTGAVAFGTGTIKGLEAIGSALGGVIGIGEDAIGKASDLNETMGKSGVVFGDAAGSMSAWADNAAKSMGLSKQAALESAASFGNLFKSLDLAPEVVAPMSKSLVGLASDLASFNNIPVEDALQKLQSGIVGQERPLRELGVAISAASVDQEAMTLGMKKQNGVFTEAQKVQARYQLILDQTKTAQGDFARTADGLANSQRTANAELEDAQATLGEKLLPVQLKVTKAAIEAIPVIIQLGDALGTLGDIAGGVAGAGAHADAEAMKEATDAATALYGGTTALAYKQRQLSIEQDNTRESTKILGVSLGTTASKAAAADDATAKLTGKTKGLGTAEQDAAAAARLLNSQIKIQADVLDSSQSAVSAYYDALITDDNLSATNAQIAADKKIIASKAVTKEQKAARAAAVKDLHQAEADQAQDLIDLAAAGKTTSAAFVRGVKGLWKELATASEARKQAILAELYAIEVAAAKAYRALQSLKPYDPSEHTHGRAGGGPVMAGQTYTVGEERPETLVMSPGGGGYVIPAAASNGGGGGGGGSLTINFNSVWPPTQAQARAIAQLVDEQTAGLLGRSAATLGRT